MNGNGVAFAAALTILGALIGLAIGWRLADLSYRRDEEVDHPHPGPRWWIPLATAAASGLLAWRFGVERWPLLLPTLPIAWFGPWLSAIDLDVRRLPNRLLATHGVVVAVGVGAAAFITGDLSIAIQAAVGGMVAFLVFWILDRVRPGGFGWGDGKYNPDHRRRNRSGQLLCRVVGIPDRLRGSRRGDPVPPPTNRVPLWALAAHGGVGGHRVVRVSVPQSQPGEC